MAQARCKKLHRPSGSSWALILSTGKSGILTARRKIYDTGFATGFGDAWLKLGALQIGIDGGVIGQTAALFEPYSNDPKQTGAAVFD